MNALSLDRVSKHYAAVPAVADVSIDFPQDAITAVIGPSGCGKSTLLKLCNGLIRPDSGSVCVLGSELDYDDLPRTRRRIGYAVQGTGLFPHLSAGRNMAMLAELEGWSEADTLSRCRELTALTQLDDELLQRYPHQLSGGQQQRVGLCRAMMLRPRLLLLDEPFAAIDPLTRADIQQQLLQLHRAEPTTTVLVTHDMHEALRLADHILVMAAGRVLHSAGTAELRQRYPGADAETLLLDLLREESS